MKRLMGLALGFFLLFGCVGKGYWMVNDPLTKTVYYTKQGGYFGERDGVVHRCPDREDGASPEF